MRLLRVPSTPIATKSATAAGTSASVRLFKITPLSAKHPRRPEQVVRGLQDDVFQPHRIAGWQCVQELLNGVRHVARVVARERRGNPPRGKEDVAGLLNLAEHLQARPDVLRRR